MTRPRQLTTLLPVLAVAILSPLVAACGGGQEEKGAASQTQNAPIDDAKVKQVLSGGFKTYGMPDSWANYGEMFDEFCKQNGVPDCKRKDTDMSSAEEIQAFDAEKGNPQSGFADIGMMFGPVAEEKGVTLPYVPKAASKLPGWAKGQEGGWVGTFVGVPAFAVNADAVESVPRTWDDLLKPEYKGKVGIADPRESGTGINTLVAAAFAKGGSEGDLAPGLAYFKKLREAGSLAPAEGDTAAMEKGEIPIQVKYDFNAVADREALKEKDIEVDVVIPEDGSIYAPSAFLMNRYFQPPDVVKKFSEFILSDEGQVIYAKFGARPIRSVTGDLEVPASARKLWLPDEDYEGLKLVNDWSKVDPEQVAESWESEVLG